jgi:hypothetical protein
MRSSATNEALDVSYGSGSPHCYDCAWGDEPLRLTEERAPERRSVTRSCGLR